jgi:hypothetical protein
MKKITTKTVILDGDMKKNAVCYECHWTMLAHEQSGAYCCQFPDCSRYGLLTVLCIVEEKEED